MSMSSRPARETVSVKKQSMRDQWTIFVNNSVDMIEWHIGTKREMHETWEPRRGNGDKTCLTQQFLRSKYDDDDENNYCLFTPPQLPIYPPAPVPSQTTAINSFY